MVVLIAGTTHTGKTALSQRLLEKYKMPYMSIDHLKMGLIRSEQTLLTTNDDSELTRYLWPIVREMIKTVIENGQDLIVEGCYIPFDWQQDLSEEYLRHIKFYCLIMTARYIENHFDDIMQWENIIEKRVPSNGVDKAVLLRENAENLQQCKKYGLLYILIDSEYNVPPEL
ncbi:MAG: adenylate kinase [Clostridia bacterium]|jgi:hypothetical protein|nr:adenylate kinase [Clostridia bacterium]